MAKMDIYHRFESPIIMAGEDFPQAEAELHRQIDMLINWDLGLAQPCHCEFHDPKQCAKDRLDDEFQREMLAYSIKAALNL